MKTALITGASRSNGIGAAIARVLAQDGINIITTYYRPYDKLINLERDSGDAEHLISELREMGVQAEGIEMDLADPTAPARLFAQINTPVDILVNNATYSIEGDIHSVTAEMIDRHYAVNVRGMMLLCHEFVKQCKNGGRIINMTSGQGLGGMPNEIAYATTKGAVDAFTVSLSAGIMQQAITVNAVDPGGTDTGWMSDELKAHIIKTSPAGRIGQPEDAARLVRFLASDEAGWITGQIIHSRGGA